MENFTQQNGWIDPKSMFLSLKTASWNVDDLDNRVDFLLNKKEFPKQKTLPGANELRVVSPQRTLLTVATRVAEKEGLISPLREHYDYGENPINEELENLREEDTFSEGENKWQE